MKVTCVACDKIIDVEDFIEETFKGRYYCSEECKNRKLKPHNKQSQIISKCKYCGKEYKTTFYKYYKKNNFYCSHKCSTDDRNKELETQCEWCGKIYQRHSTRDNARFCSRECYRSFKDKESTKTFVCGYCEKSFDLKGIKYYKTYRNGDGITRKYCSKECTDKARIGKFVDEDSPRWEGGKTSLQDIIRKSVEFKKLREECFIRDNYISIISGNGGRIIHHR